jgi:Kef-type K+ transport system membrane component KefB
MLVVTGLVWLLTGNPVVALLLGALSSATAPAATVDVLWQYKSRGPVTTTILAIVAMDDGLSLILYGFAFGIAKSLYTGNGIAVGDVLLGPFIEIMGSLALGCGTGIILGHILSFFHKEDDRLVVTLGCVLLGAGLAEQLDFSLIMVAMATGCWLTNTPKHQSEKCFEMIKGFTPPLYTLFFLLVGARLRIGLIPQIGSIGLIYVLGRTLGKWSGAYLGARLSGAADTVRRYLGFALFSQAGVALGLALHTFQYFSRLGVAGAELGGIVINVIAATTLIVQIIGPVAVKFAITKAGEVPKD